MSFVSKEIRRFGYIIVNDVQVLAAQYHFECDSASDLPTQTQFQNDKNVFLFMGSTAHTIDTDARYEMNSAGSWTQQSQPWQPLADYSVLTNKPQINGNVLTGNQSGADLGLQNTLTFDNTPTQDSVNPVTSGGIWTDQQRQDALQDEDRAALVELVNGGAKNRWKITIPTLPTGFTATVDTDGGLILNGTTGSSALTFATSTQFYAGETVVLSGCPAGGSDDSYRLDILRGANTNYCYGDPVIASAFTSTTYPVRIRIAANYTCDNLKFYPMVCTIAAWKISQSYQPYRPSWQEMYDMILALQ